MLQQMKERNINQQISQSDFFTHYNKQLKEIALSSKIEQEKLRRMKKIEKLRQKEKQSLECKEQKLLDNIVIDYLRSKNLNYSYSVFMRERNLISDQIQTKLNVIKFLGLENVYNSSDRFDLSVLQLLMMQQTKRIYQSKQLKQIGIQVQLISKDKTINNQLLNEIRIAEVRKEVEENQRKHYDILLESLKHQLSISIKEQMKKQTQVKLKKLRNQYEQQMKILKEKNKQFLVNNPKINPKVEEYLKRIAELQNNTCTLVEKVKGLQKQRISHNCFKNQKIIEKEQVLRKQKDQLQKKKNQYDLALRNLHTSIQDLTAKKQKLQQQPKQTDLFVHDLKKNKANKDYMIEEIYGRLFLMNKRVENLSKDNESLMEQNRQLLSKIKQLEALKQQLKDQYKQSSKVQDSMKKIVVKPNSKDVFVGVTQLQIEYSYKGPKKEHAIDEQLSELESKQQEDSLENKKKFKLQINNLYDQMKLIKNKLRFAVQNFQ